MARGDQGMAQEARRMRCCSDGLVVVLVVAWRMWWMWDEGGMYLVVVGCCGLAWCWEWRAAAAVAAPNLSLHSAPPRPMLPSAAARPGNRECDVMRLAAAGLGVSTSCGLWLCASRGWALEGGECFCLETPPKFPDAVALGRTRDAAAAQTKPPRSIRPAPADRTIRGISSQQPLLQRQITDPEARSRTF